MCLHKATGLVNLPARFIRGSGNVIVKHLTHTDNLLLQTGEVPGDMKWLVVTLHKKTLLN